MVLYTSPHPDTIPIPLYSIILRLWTTRGNLLQGGRLLVDYKHATSGLLVIIVSYCWVVGGWRALVVIVSSSDRRGSVVPLIAHSQKKVSAFPQ